MRKPFQGLWNIVRFNWPFYFLSAVVLLVVFVLSINLDGPLAIAADVFLVLVIGTVLTSLSVSFYVYDLSGLYDLKWLDQWQRGETGTIVNINAGFDETSGLLEKRFGDMEMIVLDFYDSSRHTESSIKRAREAYPPFPNTLSVSTSEIPLEDRSVDKIFAILSAHEIRNDEERKAFFGELNRALAPSGQIVVVEHLRDAANYLAYNIGALHFQSRATWLSAFREAGLKIENEMKITPFITIFFLIKNGITS
jgi:SAM-dependent methyltransferase